MTIEQIAERAAKQWHGEAEYEWRIKGLTNLILFTINEATKELQESQMMDKMEVTDPLVPVDESPNRPDESPEGDQQGDSTQDEDLDLSVDSEWRVRCDDDLIDVLKKVSGRRRR